MTNDNRSKGKSGFSLIQLLVVLFIIGILAAIAIPMYRTQTLRARMMEINKTMSSIAEAYGSYSNVEGYPLRKIQESDFKTYTFFRSLNRKALDRVVRTAFVGGEFPNEEVFVTSLRIKKLMDEYKNNQILVYISYDQGSIPVLKKKDQEYELEIDKQNIKDLLAYMSLLRY